MARKPEIKIKTTPNQIDVATPTEITNLPILAEQIMKAKEATDLIMPGVSLDALRKHFDIKNKKLQDAVKIETDKAAVIKKLIDLTIKNIKEKALEVVKVDTKSSLSKSTGEMVTKTKHNLPTEIFSYTPLKKGAVIDTKALLEDPKKYKKFLKVVYEVDTEKVATASADELPYIEKVTDAKISFKKLDVVTLEKLLGSE